MYFLMSNKQKLGSYLKITVMKNDKKYIYIYTRLVIFVCCNPNGGFQVPIHYYITSNDANPFRVDM